MVCVDEGKDIGREEILETYTGAGTHTHTHTHTHTNTHRSDSPHFKVLTHRVSVSQSPFPNLPRPKSNTMLTCWDTHTGSPFPNLRLPNSASPFPKCQKSNRFRFLGDGGSVVTGLWLNFNIFESGPFGFDSFGCNNQSFLSQHVKFGCNNQSFLSQHVKFSCNNQSFFCHNM